MQGEQVRALVREPRSHMLCSVTGKKKKKKTKERTTSHSLFPYLHHLHSPVMQPVWPRVIWLMVDDGHVLTLWKRNMKCVGSLAGMFRSLWLIWEQMSMDLLYIKWLILKSNCKMNWQAKGLVTQMEKWDLMEFIFTNRKPGKFLWLKMA